MRNYKITSVKFTPTPQKWEQYKDKQDAVFHIDEHIILGGYTVVLDNGDIYTIYAGVWGVGECGMYDTKGKRDNIYEDDIIELAKDDEGLAALTSKNGWEWQNNPWYVYEFGKNGVGLTPDYVDEVAFDFDEATETLQAWSEDTEPCRAMFYDMLDKIM